VALVVERDAKLLVGMEPGGEGLSNEEVEEGAKGAALADASRPKVTAGLSVLVQMLVHMLQY